MHHDVRAPSYSGDQEHFMNLITIYHCSSWPLKETLRVFGVSPRDLGPLIMHDTARMLRRIMMDLGYVLAFLTCSFLFFLS